LTVGTGIGGGGGGGAGVGKVGGGDGEGTGGWADDREASPNPNVARARVTRNARFPFMIARAYDESIRLPIGSGSCLDVVQMGKLSIVAYVNLDVSS
jgi:hypothetical protein